LKANTRRVTELEYQYNSSVYDPENKLKSNTQSIFGYNSLVSYNVSDTNIDDIHFDQIVLMSTDPQPTKVNGVDAIKYLMLTLYNVDFFDYSYAKTIND